MSRPDPTAPLWPVRASGNEPVGALFRCAEHWTCRSGSSCP